jgi:kynureninase
LQERFATAIRERPLGPFALEHLVVPLTEPARGNFLVFEHPQAAGWSKRLHAHGVITDHRGTHLRLGFGLHQTADDVDQLMSRLGAIGRDTTDL